MGHDPKRRILAEYDIPDTIPELLRDTLPQHA
jgi:hypothetical protein